MVVEYQHELGVLLRRTTPKISDTVGLVGSWARGQHLLQRSQYVGGV